MPNCQDKTKDHCRQHQPDESETWREVYERLEKATPEEKTDIVLRLIEEYPKGRLELPERDEVRANLSKVDLSRDTLKARLAQLKTESAPWWVANLQGADLWYARLQGVDLSTAIITHIRISGAWLDRTRLTW
jgi:uncharacterized protein YjbI with pentapeptide repeats